MTRARLDVPESAGTDAKEDAMAAREVAPTIPWIKLVKAIRDRYSEPPTLPQVVARTNITIQELRRLPVAERMELVGMIPVQIDRDGEPYYDGARLPSSVLDDLWTVLND